MNINSSVVAYFSRIGKIGGSRPKHYSKKEIAKRKERIMKYNELRRAQKNHDGNTNA